MADEPNEDWWINACLHLLECRGDEDCPLCQRIKQSIGEGAGT